MMLLYLSSLYHLLFVQNPIGEIGVDLYRTWKAFWNVQKNMKRAKFKVASMQQRIQRMELCIQEVNAPTSTKLDVYR